MTKQIVTITGPSASGKSTLERMLCEGKDSEFDRVISTTTRAPRDGEVNGRDYYFVSFAEFAELDKSGQLLEQTNFNGDRYGATVSEIDRIHDAGLVPVIVVDPEGAEQIQKSAANRWLVHSFFLTNPAEVRYKRLLERFTRDFLFPPVRTGSSLDRYAKRFAYMELVESLWAADAHKYDHVILKFDSDNSQQVVRQVIDVVTDAWYESKQS